MNSKLVVAIINIGDCYSSCALSFSHDMIPNVLGLKGINFELPNTILYNEKEEFEAFGYDAEEKYLEASEKGDANNWLYFRQFTNGKYKNSSNFTIETYDNKNEMPLTNILSSTIQYFKHKILHIMLPKQPSLKQAIFREGEIFWILVASDYLHNSAKHLLVQSCNNCGFENDQILIESESLAMSISCRQYLGSQPGRSYILVDSVLRETFKGVTSDLPLTSVSKFEGTTLFWHLQQWFSRMIGLENWQNFTSNYQDFADLFENFDIVIRSKVDLDKSVTFKVPISLMQCIRSIPEISEDVGDIRIIGDKIRVNSTVLFEALQKSSESFLSDLAYIIKENRAKDESMDILIVGKLSKIGMFQFVLERKFVNINIKCLAEEDVSVIHGASLIGHSPQLLLTSGSNCQIITHQMETAHIQLHHRYYKRNIQPFSVNSCKNEQNGGSLEEMATLSDPNRPVKIAERYNDLFEVDWPKCIEQLNTKGIHIETAIEILFKIVTESFMQCTRYFQTHFEKLMSLLNPWLTDMDIEMWRNGQLVTSVRPGNIVVPITRTRRKTISQHTPIILESLLNEIAKKFKLDGEQIAECRKFAMKCVENSCYMQTTEKPMYMDWNFHCGEIIDWSVLEVVGKHGNLIDKLIWPVIYLHKYGQLMNKGKVQAK